jgi:hypothetical protein
MKRPCLIARTAILFLYGVAPIEPVCERAILSDVPATAREWEVVASYDDQFRIRRTPSSEWLVVTRPLWRSDALLGQRLVERWEAGRRVSTADSLIAPWSEIERIDQRFGSNVGAGMMKGGLVGAASAFVFTLAYCTEERGWGCGFVFIPAVAVAVPIGLAAGAVIGKTQPRWRVLYCSPGEANDDPGEEGSPAP